MVRYAFPKEPSGCRVCWRGPSRCECTGKGALLWSRENAGTWFAVVVVGMDLGYILEVELPKAVKDWVCVD